VADGRLGGNGGAAMVAKDWLTVASTTTSSSKDLSQWHTRGGKKRRTGEQEYGIAWLILTSKSSFWLTSNINMWLIFT